MTGLLDRLFSVDGLATLLALPFVQTALVAAALLGLVAGALAPLIVARGMAFAVHGTAEIAFTGGAAALLLGISVSVGAVVGSLVAAVVFGLLGLRQRERDSVIGVVLAFGLGLGVLLVSLYQGRTANKFGLLTGSIVSVDSGNLAVLAVITVLVLGTLAVLYRPHLFATADPDVAKISVVGVGMRSHAGVAAQMFQALAGRGINVLAITTSEIKVSVLIHEDYVELAVRVLHTAYGLDAADEAA